MRTPRSGSSSQNGELPSAVQIYVRFRPIVSKKEIECPQIHRINRDIVRVDGAQSSSRDATPRSVRSNPSPMSGSRRVHGGVFQFHRVFGPTTPTSELYIETAEPMIDTLFNGYNCTMMAYGISGSGKTHTMMGRPSHDKDRGIIPRVIEDIFTRAESRKEHGWSSTFTISNVQIYNEKVLDLLSKGKFDPETDHSLSIRQRLVEGHEEIFIEGVTWKKVESVSKCLKWIQEGDKHRVVASTKMNSVSSRSHMVFMFRLEQVNNHTSEHLVSNFYLVDLAGSETAKRTGAKGNVLKQACHVNLSLTTLSSVISALSNRKPHIPYRDSKLTRLLTHALGGNSRTAIILTCSPSEESVNETVSTLQFGKRALDMPNKPKVNHLLTIKDYQKMLEKAHKNLEKQKLIIQGLEHANSRLSALLDEHDIGNHSTSVEEGNEKDDIEHFDESKSHVDENYEDTHESKSHVDEENGGVHESKSRENDPLDSLPRIHMTEDSNTSEPPSPPLMRFFTPRSVEALSTSIVQSLEREKIEMVRELSEKREECNTLQDRLVEARDKIHTLNMKTPCSINENSSPVVYSEECETRDVEEEEEKLRHGVLNSGQDRTATVVFLSVGSIVLVGGLVAMLVLHLQYQFPLHPAFWGTLSASIVGSLLLGWGLPPVGDEED